MGTNVGVGGVTVSVGGPGSLVGVAGISVPATWVEVGELDVGEAVSPGFPVPPPGIGSWLHETSPITTRVIRIRTFVFIRRSQT